MILESARINLTASAPSANTLPFATFLVGGAVRDALLGTPSKDRDWLVVGATPTSMLAAGFTQVGADFPVFLHPESREEYALARTERKHGRGYRGFVVQADPDVTLTQDLARRDLTINAIAQSPDGTLHDPFGGVADLRSGCLRHVTEAFAEDPLRVLRVARFAARYAPRGFYVAPETIALMQSMVRAGELAFLTPERVFEELRKALAEPAPQVFLRILRRCGALRVVLPELDALYGVPQRAEFHPEIDSGVHQEMVTAAAARIAPGDVAVGFSALLHDLGKAKTASQLWPKHIDHEEAGLAPLDALCSRLRVPTELHAMARCVCREHLNVHRLSELRPGSVVDLLERIDAFRKPDRVRVLALACNADKAGRLLSAEADYPQASALQHAFDRARAVRAAEVIKPGMAGEQIAQALHQARAQAVRSASRA
jgi:tRNA nucleotidyltransferase (CCA-adding enzyme)